ncbi:hypothetical protein [Thalassomonas sp. RHCl1]|uniref:hypothetical protein n=1 Tax=Thalassomonas sp. RHCl1 TaxID=2995320 RepID=UPI00248B843E|nr:hypothetical protein [Thalassomonas sp. RHCl1]
MKAVLERLGQNPQQSLKLFLRGFGLFIVGALAIMLGYFTDPLWQIPGLLLLVPGVVMAAIGYLGIFANRLLNIFNRTRVRKDLFK